MTPLTKARQILQSVNDAASAYPGFDLPSQQYAQIGTPVIACEVFTVAALQASVNGAQLGQLAVECDVEQMCDFVIVVAYDCGVTFNNDGSDDPTAITTVSELQDAVGQFLWEWAQNYDEYVSKTWGLSWVLEGALSITTLTLTTGVD